MDSIIAEIALVRLIVLTALAQDILEAVLIPANLIHALHDALIAADHTKLTI